MRRLGKELPSLGIAADEPVVLVRGTDPFAAHLLRDYAARLEETGRPQLAAEARKGADQIAAWQSAYPPVWPEEPVITRRPTKSLTG